MGHALLASEALVHAHLLKKEAQARLIPLPDFSARRYCLGCESCLPASDFTPTSLARYRCRRCHPSQHGPYPRAAAKRTLEEVSRKHRKYATLLCLARVEIFMLQELLLEGGEVLNIEKCNLTWCFECGKALPNTRFTPTSLAKYHCQPCEKRLNKTAVPKTRTSVLMKSGYKFAKRFARKHDVDPACFGQWSDPALFARLVFDPFMASSMMTREQAESAKCHYELIDKNGQPSPANVRLVLDTSLELTTSKSRAK
jgi:hypothetical protein